MQKAKSENFQEVSAETSQTILKEQSPGIVVCESRAPMVEAVTPQPVAAVYQKRSQVYAKPAKTDLERYLRILSDPTTPEADWLRVCHLMGDYTHTPRRTKSMRNKLVAATAMLLVLGGSAVWIQRSVVSASVDAPVQPPATISSDVGHLPVTVSDPPSRAPSHPASSASVEPDFTDYMTDMQRDIKSNWFPPKSKVSAHVKAAWKIRPDGKLIDPRIVESSGNTAMDEAAMEAIKTSGPFDRLPEGASDEVSIEFTFDYNVNARDKGFL